MTEVAVLLLTVIVVVDSRVVRIRRRPRPMVAVVVQEDISIRERGPEARLRTQERT